MNRFRNFFVAFSAVSGLILAPVFQAEAVAPGPKVSEDKNKHNLSSAMFWNGAVPQPVPAYSANTPYSARDTNIKYKATYDVAGNRGGLQICIFCHTPHNANVVNQSPLWNRKFSEQTFSRYSSATLQIRVNAAARTPAQYEAGAQPDGSSKLCLSCHDGVSNLGDVIRGGPITMDVSGGNKITTRASFNPTTNKMKFGHHPVSFVYNGVVQQAISSGRAAAGYGGGYGFVLPGTGSEVKLDKNKKMQCTTCHNPHQNMSHDDKCYNADGTAIVDCPADGLSRKVAPFWVKSIGADVIADHDWVCNNCHNLAGKYGIPTDTTSPTPPVPFPYP